MQPTLHPIHSIGVSWSTPLPLKYVNISIHFGLIMSKEKVENLLTQLENEYNIDIFIAKDFGSKAWNVDTESSDHDVGFVFLQPSHSYIHTHDYKENISRHFEFNGKEHTFQGWNFRRFLELYTNSNPIMIEFCASPLTYRRDPEISGTWQDLEQLATEEFNPIGAYYHYRKLAKEHYKRYIAKRVFDKEKDRSYEIIESSSQTVRLQDEEGEGAWKLAKDNIHRSPRRGRYYFGRREATAKRYLYILRATMYAEYIKQTHTFPSLDLVKFRDEELPEIDVPETNVQEFQDMIRMKKTGQADEEVGNPGGQYIEHFINQKLDNQKHNKDGLPEDKVREAVKKILVEKECGD